MKLFLPLISGVVASVLVGWQPQSKQASVIYIGGNSSGYLSPCGCVKPMTGGIRRKATYLRQNRLANDLYVELGPFVKDTLRQSQLKLDTLAEFGASANVDAMGLTAKDLAFDPAILAASNSLSKNKFIQSQTAGVNTIISTKGWTIGSLSPARGGLQQAWRMLEVEADGEPILVMFDGDEAAATAFAANRPGLQVVCYPSLAPEARNVGGVMVVGTGERGKFVGRLDLVAKKYRSIALTPEYADDPAVSRIYRRYLDRVTGENLIALEPRAAAKAFAGSRACQPCHTKIYDQWTKTGHGKAFVTLKKDAHDFDPDCVKCHVVGLDKVTGFKSEKLTPQLQHVGCESCHGPSRDHAKKPKVYKSAPATEKSCASCHVPDHSPAFSFDSYWKKIKHGK